MISRWNSAALRIIVLIAALQCLVFPSGPVAYARPQESDASTITIPDGTPLHLYLMDDLNSKKTRNGDTVRFKVREGIRVRDVEVIPVDSSVTGHVVAVGRSNFAGHSGKLGLVVDYVIAVNGAKIPVRGEATVTGGSNGAVTAAATAVHGPAALFIRGWDADIHKGTMLNAYVNGDQAIILGRSNAGK